MKKEKVEKLLRLYFDGKSSINEEKMLRRYIMSDDISPEFMKYREMFKYFSYETEKINGYNRYRYRGNRNKLIISFAAVAASIVAFLLTINHSEVDKIRVVVGGEKLNDNEIALQIVNKQLSKINIMSEIVDRNINKLNNVAVLEKYFWFVDENGAIGKVPELLNKLPGGYNE
jgi:hypothetical protein